MEYPLCDQTVTVYRQEGDAVSRQVLHGCYLQQTQSQLTQDRGTRMQQKFLLVVPGERRQILPGDRVMAGEGPEAQDWSRFIPALIPGLCQISWVRPCYFRNQLCHTEAGN